MNRLVRSLYFWVILGVTAGVLLGMAAPDTAAAMKPLGDGFIKLIKMLIAPVIFCTIVTGVAGMNDMQSAGRIGVKSLLYFEAVTTLALVIGLAVVHLGQPGAGMNIDPATLDGAAISPYAAKAQSYASTTDFLLGIIPATLFEAFVKGDILQVLFVSLLFALALLSLGKRGRPMRDMVQHFSDVLFRMIGFIVRLAPLGAFGAMAYTVGKHGVGTLAPLIELMLLFYLTCILFVAVVLGAVMRLCGCSLWRLLVYLKDEILLVLGTSSSEAALPRLIEKMIRAGCARPVVSMVVPTGYSFNLDGTSIYLTMAAVFIAQATNTPLTLAQELGLLAVLLLTSKGAAGVTGSGFIVLAATLSATNAIPVEGLVLILGIDRFMSEARAITNFIGNAVATVVISKWERALDSARAAAVLGRRHEPRRL